jgi:dolichol-phosphate mannosyltransferase
MRNMNDCIVIIPINEIENIESIIRAVLSQHKLFHVLIVDDNSLTIQTRFDAAKGI